MNDEFTERDAQAMQIVWLATQCPDPNWLDIDDFIAKSPLARFSPAQRERLLQALLELCGAVGQHEDSMTAEGALHAPMLKASDIAIRACPPPKPLLNAVEMEGTIP